MGWEGFYSRSVLPTLLVAAESTLQPFQVVSPQPTPVLFPGLFAEAKVSIAPLHMFKHNLGWGEQGSGQDSSFKSLSLSLSLFYLLRAGCSTHL